MALVRFSLRCIMHGWARASSVPNQMIKYNKIRSISEQIRYLSIAAKPKYKLEPKGKQAVQIPDILNRTPRKKRMQTDEASELGFLNVQGFATAKEYDLERVKGALASNGLGTTKRFPTTCNSDLAHNILYIVNSSNNTLPCEILIFREGSVVFWNCDPVHRNNVLALLRKFEKESYPDTMVFEESESMPYTYIPNAAIDIEGDLVADSSLSKARAYFQTGKFFISSAEDNFLYKYTFSNAMAQSIKLGIWENILEDCIDSMEYLTDDLKRGKRLRITRADVLRKTGELLALRYAINLSSDLLDAPDFYWDREELETLYMQICSYFSISKRTKVMNEKINRCVELADLVSNKLNDEHHIRLEWMIIILIMIEVGFEIYHCID